MPNSRKTNTYDKIDRVTARSLPVQIPETQARVRSEAVLNNNKSCGATTRSGAKCRQPAMANGKCYKHGGRSQGEIMARPGNRNALTHGTFLPDLLDEREQSSFRQFIDDLFRVFPELNDAGDLRHAEMAAFAYVRLVRAFIGDAASSTIDDLSRVLTRHLAAIRANRDQRVIDGESKSGPKSPAEYAVEIIQQVKMYSKGGKVPMPIDPSLIGLESINGE